jgi:hypothetical protein
VLAADARVVSQEQVATAGQLRCGTQAHFGQLIDAARSNWVQVHTDLARAADGVEHIFGVVVVVRRVRDQERKPSDLVFVAPGQLRHLHERSVRSFREVTAATR